MKKRSRTFTAVLIIIVGILFIAYQSLKLDEPYFLNIESEVIIYETNEGRPSSTFSLSYITDIFSKKSIDSITFIDDKDNEYSGITDFNQEPDPVGFYRQYHYFMTIQPNRKFTSDNNGSEINMAKVSFSDGTQQDINIGRLIVYADKDPREFIFKRGMGTMMDFSTYVEGDVLKDFKLIGITSPLMKEYGEDYTLLVNEQEPSKSIGFSFITNSSIKVTTQPNANMLKSRNIYDINVLPLLTIEDDNGTQHEIYFPEPGGAYSPLSYKELRYFLKHK